MGKIRRAPVLFLALPWLASSMVGIGEGPRHALIIANDYANDPSLALDGAEALAQEFTSTLEQMMWHVKTYRAASRSKMHDAIRRFSNTLSEVHDGVALFIFIGRGVHLNGRNLMVPAKLPVHEPKSYLEDVEHEAVAVEKVLRRMQAADTTNFVILDAGMGAKSSVLFPGLAIGGMRPSGSAAALNMHNTLVVYGGSDDETGSSMQPDGAEVSRMRSRLPGLPRGPLLSACLLRRMVAGLSLKQQRKWLAGKTQPSPKGQEANAGNGAFGADLGSVQRLLSLDALLRRVRADVVAASALGQHIATFSTMVHDVLLNPGAVDAVLKANLAAHGASAGAGDGEVHGEVEVLADGTVGAQGGDLGGKLSFLELARGIAVALAGNGAGGSAAVEHGASGAGGDSSDLQHALLDASAFAALRRDRLRQLRAISTRHNAAQEREAELARERAAAAARLEQQRRDAAVREDTARRAASSAGFEYTHQFPDQDLRLRFVSTEAQGRENNAAVTWHATASELVKATGAGWNTAKYPPVAEGDIVVAVNGERTAGWNLKRVSAALDAATKTPGMFSVAFRTVRSESDYRRDAALARVGQWEWKQSAGAPTGGIGSEQPSKTEPAAPPSPQPTPAPTPQQTPESDDSAELLEAARAAVKRVRKEERVEEKRRDAARKIQQLRARFNKDNKDKPKAQSEGEGATDPQAPAQAEGEGSEGGAGAAESAKGGAQEKKKKAKARALKAQEHANAKKAAQAEESVKAKAKAAADAEKQAKTEADSKAAEQAKAESDAKAKAKAAKRAKVAAEEKAAENKKQEATIKEKERRARVKAKAEAEKRAKAKKEKKSENRLKKKAKHKESQQKESAAKVEKQQKEEARLAEQKAAAQSVSAEEAVANAVNMAAEKGVKKQLNAAGFSEPEQQQQQQKQPRAAATGGGNSVKRAGDGVKHGDSGSSKSSPADRVKAAVEKATKAAMKDQLESGGF